jgi:excinuclease ABC subunit C
VIKNLEQEMKAEVEKEHFEQAARLRDSWQAVKSVTEQHYPMKPNPILPALKVDQTEESIIQLRQLLSSYLELPKNYPLERIEGYDVSNIQGTNAAVAMVTFINGESETDEYRLFNIKTILQPNDYGMLQEALQRRQNHPEWGMPDLVVIDGGKGQLRAALSVWQQSTPVISIAKKPDRIIIPASFNYLMRQNPEMKKFQPKYYELQLSPDHLALRLIQRIRDESHRFSKKQHTRRRTKMMFK